MMHILSVATGVRVCHWQVGYAVDVTRLPRIDHLTRLARAERGLGVPESERVRGPRGAASPPPGQERRCEARFSSQFSW